VKNTDQIVVFENGKVVETGMFDELSEIDGYFTQFLRTSSTSSTKK
jgi:ABC-type multidrug transport system fused ATPase/permease subunit